MLDNHEKIELKQLDNIEYFVSSNRQLFFNMNKIEKSLKHHISFSEFLKLEDNKYLEYSRSIMHHNKFGFEASEEYADSFYIVMKDQLFVDYFIACVYIYQSNDKILISKQNDLFVKYIL